MSKRLTAVIHREGNGFVALCPEVDVASQGDTIETARDNLREAVTLVLEANRELAERSLEGRSATREPFALPA